MAHCLPPMGLCQRQKNQGEEEEQERVRGEPSLVIVPNLGNLDTISIPLASSPLKIRRRGRRRGNENVMFGPHSPVSQKIDMTRCQWLESFMCECSLEADFDWN